MPSTTTIAGRYRIEGRLGVGGMSMVMLAFDERLERYVAVKLLAEHLADDPTFVSRFRREALAAARLVHPNIVQVFDFGLDSSSHQHYIVMEHVAGHSCAELLRDRGHLRVDQAVEIVTQSCRGLDYAHRNGVVHRDVKPGNLLVSGTDVVKLADFGIARAVDQSSITQVGSVLGTAAYLSPEQARGEEAGPRADIYSLGVVTYQLLSGRLPYEAASLSELALKQQRESPLPLSTLNTQVPPELAKAVAWAFAIDQESRPSDAMVFAKAIQDGVQGIAPTGAASAQTGGSKAVTRVLPRRASEQETAATRVTPERRSASRAPGRRDQGSASPVRAQPVRAPSRAQADPRTPATAASARGANASDTRRPRASRGRALRRLMLLLGLIAVFVVAVVVAVTVATTASPPVVHYRVIVAHDVTGAVNSLKTLISKYTK